MYRLDVSGWYLERIVLLIAGCFILVSLALAYLVSLWWLILAVLVGINLSIFALTGYCVMAAILHSLGVVSREEMLAGRRIRLVE